jgi:hypothetical protein
MGAPLAQDLHQCLQTPGVSARLAEAAILFAGPADVNRSLPVGSKNN